MGFFVGEWAVVGGRLLAGRWCNQPFLQKCYHAGLVSLFRTGLDPNLAAKAIARVARGQSRDHQVPH